MKPICAERGLSLAGGNWRRRSMPARKQRPLAMLEVIRGQRRPRRSMKRMQRNWAMRACEGF